MSARVQLIRRAGEDVRPEPGPARQRGWPAIGGLALAGIGVAWFMAMAPVAVGFVFAVAAAVCWCIWLEDHEGSGES
ncbi:MAG TPA: hypothetical protein VFV98_05245 [Vicinamibacterales bacterium]|nr:hypothetical protein [Vicinamibacterales bacterium]